MTDFKELTSIMKGEVLFDVPMKDHTSMRVGGTCACMVTPRDTEDVQKFIDWSRDNGQKYLVIGAGTNMIVRDGGIKHPLIRIKDTLDTLETEREDASGVKLRVGAGKPLAGLVKYCSEAGLSGLEPLSGIPGTVGGAIFMNAGTGRGTISEAVETVTFIERTGRTKTLEKARMGFGYRVCAALSSSSIVVSALLSVRKSSPEKVSKKAESVLKEKTEAQPLSYPSSGSIFKNPPKVRAWQLLDEAGLRGVRVRGAKYSELHTNFIVNVEQASAADVLALIDAGMEKVREKTGVKLELEVIVVGES